MIRTLLALAVAVSSMSLMSCAAMKKDCDSCCAAPAKKADACATCETPKKK
jgi:hypothetical protein